MLSKWVLDKKIFYLPIEGLLSETNLPNETLFIEPIDIKAIRDNK